MAEEVRSSKQNDLCNSSCPIKREDGKCHWNSDRNYIESVDCFG